MDCVCCCCCCCCWCIVDRTDVGTGGITGRASCASSELTTPRLGARILGTVRDDIETEPPEFCCCCCCCCDPPDCIEPPDADDDDDADAPLLFVVAVVEFCSSCLSSTFCESSALGAACDCCADSLRCSCCWCWCDCPSLNFFETLPKCIIDASSPGPVGTSTLCRFRPIMAAGCCSLAAAGSSMDLERRKAATAAAELPPIADSGAVS